MTCTWDGCANPDEAMFADKDGKPWANLCEFHSAKMTEAIESGDPKKYVGCWIKAQGGAKAAAARMTNRAK